MLICLFSLSADIATRTIARVLDQKQVSHFLFSFGGYPKLSKVSLELNNNQAIGTLTNTYGSVTTNQISAFWNSQKGRGLIQNAADHTLAQYVLGESRTLIRGLSDAMPNTFWMSRQEAMLQASVKPHLLNQARLNGFRIPASCIGNSPEAVAQFTEQYPRIAIKSLSNPKFSRKRSPLQQFFYQLKKPWKSPFSKVEETANAWDLSLDEPSRLYETHQTYTIFTQCLSHDELTENVLASIKHCPIIVQEYIPKQLELRVIVVGERVFTCAIDSQALPESTVDFRALDNYDQKLKHTIHTLPDDIAERCVQHVKDLGLEYGAIDLILTPEGEYVYLELNTTGAWYWLEEQTGLPIAEAIADHLITGAKAMGH